MLRINGNLKSVFSVPRIYFTLKGNERSEAVMKLLGERLASSDFADSFNGFTLHDQECRVLDNEAAVQAMFEGGISPDSAVALFDVDRHKRFAPTSSSRVNHGIPGWARGTQWGMAIGTSCDRTNNRQQDCANQTAAMFNRNFRKRVDSKQYPWGPTKAKEMMPSRATLPDHAHALVKRLNAHGPDIAGSMADQECALELPVGSRISWYRVPPDPFSCDTDALDKVLAAFIAFERACDQLVRQNADVQKRIMAGVDVVEELENYYLFPNSQGFSVRRPDLHLTSTGVFSSENDEMPGGFAECCHIDSVYGINERRWQDCFDWLTQAGPLLLVVSHEWSRCYIPEMAWLQEHMTTLGYQVKMVTTDAMDEVSVRDDGVYYQDHKIGTVWRQFPIFETKGKLVDLVKASHAGTVRLYPEFAHYGNKVWYSIFRSHTDYYRRTLDQDTFELLDAILPDSHLIRSREDFPCQISHARIADLRQLLDLPQNIRDLLVLKIAGANNLAARSYGVLMGHGLNQRVWKDWIADRLSKQQPFIVQRRLETDVVQLSVLNTKSSAAEMFPCRVLMRPWVVNNRAVSVATCAVPSNTLRVHGRVDMAVLAVDLA